MPLQVSGRDGARRQAGAGESCQRPSRARGVFVPLTRPRPSPISQALLAEYVGTIILVLATRLALNDPDGVAFVAVGMTLCALIYAFDHVSGAQFNPAVTIGLVITRKMSLLTGVLYIIVQTLGGLTGGLLAYAIASPKDIKPFVPANGTGASWAAEFLYAFALILVQQNVGVEKNANEPNSYFGIAVAFTVLSGAAATFQISGACFNPAIGTGVDFAAILVSGDFGLTNIWIYWTAPVMGALAASAVKFYQNHPLHGEVSGLPLTVPLTEAVGTFFIVLTASLTNEPLAIGGMVLAMVYMGDHVSGADFNPAVSLGVAIRMGLPLNEYWKVLVIMAAQFAGAFAGALSAYGIVGNVSLPNGGVDAIRGLYGAVVFEAIFTGLVVYVVCAVMTPTRDDDDTDTLEERRGHSRSYHGIAIGFIVAGGIYASGPYGGGSGGVFNPALGTSIIAVRAAFNQQPVAAEQLWVYWIGPLAGSLLGSGLFSLLHHHVDPVVADYVEGTENESLS